MSDGAIHGVPFLMPENIGAQQIPDKIVDAAIAWLVKLDYSAATSNTSQAFEAWLHADPLHAQAWSRVGEVRKSITGVSGKLALETLKYNDAQRQVKRLSRRQVIKLLSVIGAVVTGAPLAERYTPWQRWVADNSTQFGQQRELILSDGTTVTLNIDTAISTSLAGDSRMLVLLRGEILITTGLDQNAVAKRPFWVDTPVGKMQALGTRFVVRLDKERVRVSVQEGAVELHSGDGRHTVIVQPGESFWLTENKVSAAETQGLESDAWADGVISGRNIRLGDLLDELGRYRRGHISCDPQVADLRVSGTFHIKDTSQALQFIEQTQPVKVDYMTRFWVSVGPLLKPKN
jgi:transmembrane sensor